MRPLTLFAVILVIAGCGTKTPLTLPSPPSVPGTAAPAPATAGSAAVPGR